LAIEDKVFAYDPWVDLKTTRDRELSYRTLEYDRIVGESVSLPIRYGVWLASAREYGIFALFAGLPEPDP